MKRLFLLVCVVFIFSLLTVAGGEGSSIRLRVIGASDSVQDVENKRKVFCAVGDLLEKADFKDVEEAEEWILSNLCVIEDEAYSVLCEKETVHAALRNEYYDEEEIFCYSLVITLGEGKGHNFFTTLFPRAAKSLSRAPKNAEKKPLFTFFDGSTLLEARLKIFDIISLTFS